MIYSNTSLTICHLLKEIFVFVYIIDLLLYLKTETILILSVYL